MPEVQTDSTGRGHDMSFKAGTSPIRDDRHTILPTQLEDSADLLSGTGADYTVRVGIHGVVRTPRLGMNFAAAITHAHPSIHTEKHL